MKILQAGPIKVGYENGFLRRIRYGETEVLRMIYFALRDRNWNTMESKIENEKITFSLESFDVSYSYVNFSGGKAVMKWNDITIKFFVHSERKKEFSVRFLPRAKIKFKTLPNCINSFS